MKPGAAIVWYILLVGSKRQKRIEKKNWDASGGERALSGARSAT